MNNFIPIPWAPCYAVNKFGVVQSNKRYDVRYIKPKYYKDSILAFQFRVKTRVGITSIYKSPHVLVAEMFVNNPNKMINIRVAFKDKNNRNIRPDNLKWVPANEVHTIWRELSDIDVKEIRYYLGKGKPISAIGRKYKVCRQSIQDIKKQKSYKWILEKSIPRIDNIDEFIKTGEGKSRVWKKFKLKQKRGIYARSKDTK